MQESAVSVDRRSQETSQSSGGSLYQRLKRLHALHGSAGLFHLFVAKFIGLVLWLTPARRRARAAAREKDLQFDRQWGVDTSGCLVPEESEVVGSSWIHGSRYQGVDAEMLEQTLSELSIDCKEFTFIDYGSGKGRAVLIASRLPFQKVIGVEYSEPLNEVARRNVEIFRKSHTALAPIDVVWADALEYPVPEGPLVVFLYNPFGQAIMSQLVERISTSYARDPRRILVLYFYATFPEAWRDAGFLREIRATKALSIYDSSKQAS